MQPRNWAFSFVLSCLLGISSWASAASVVASLKISPAGSFQAKTSSVKGGVKQQGPKIVAAGPITVDLASLTTGMKLRDEHMKDKYLEVKKFPTATLTLGEGMGGKGRGKLKLRNIEKDIEGTYKVQGKNLEARFNIKLSDFNITGIRYMGAGVKDEAEIVAVVPVQ